MKRIQVLNQSFYIDNGDSKTFTFNLLQNSSVKATIKAMGSYTQGCSFVYENTLVGKNTSNVVFSNSFFSRSSYNDTFDFGVIYSPIIVSFNNTSINGDEVNQIVFDFISTADGNPFEGNVDVNIEIEEVTV